MSQESLLFLKCFPAPMSESWRPSQPFPYEEMKLRTDKGLLHGVLWLAPNAKGTVLYSHGNAENIGVIQNVSARFVRQGYNILIWDYRGYGLSTGEFCGQAGLLADAESVYRWLAAHKDAGEIVLYGRSLGSGIALYLGHSHAGHKVLLEAAYDSLASVAQDHYPIFPTKFLIQYPMPAAQWAADIRAPIYIVHGTDDRLIPPEHPMALAKAAPNAKLTLIKGGGHNKLSNFAQYDEWLKSAL